MRAIAIRVFGKVQGVWFRASTKREADSLGIRGRVTNQPDGSVLIHALGDDSQVDRLIAWCHEGPLHARVERVECTPWQADTQYNSFDILR